jgi:hypothetical protein
MWVLHYVVLTEEYIHFFSGAREDYLGHHDFQIPLRKVSAVDDGPPLSGEFAKHGTVRLELMGTDRPVTPHSLCICNLSQPFHLFSRPANQLGRSFSRWSFVPMIHLGGTSGKTPSKR